jgi:hypothetical protein
MLFLCPMLPLWYYYIGLGVVFNAISNNISAISWWSILLGGTAVPGENHLHGTNTIHIFPFGRVTNTYLVKQSNTIEV